MSSRRPKYRGYLLKSEFCKKYGISNKEFTEKLLQKKLLERVLISSGIGPDSRYREKYSLAIGGWISWQIMAYSGSNRKGIYQYHENYFKKVFGL